MAATSFAEMAEMAHEAYDREMIRQQIPISDLLLRRAPLIPTVGGKHFVQRMVDAQNSAVFGTYYTEFADNALAYAEYKGFLARVLEQMQVPAPVAGIMNDPNGLANHLAEHKDGTIRNVLRKIRDNYIVGQPASVTIGADWTTAGVTAVEPGPRMFDVEDVHSSTTPTARNHALDWDESEDKLRYRPYGETTWGPWVVMSADNDTKVPLFNADGTKWVWVTVTYATLDAQVDLQGDGTDDKSIKMTPTKSMTGWRTLVHPTQRVWGNLSATDPTAAGDTLTIAILFWMVQKLIEASEGDLSKCCMVCSLEIFLKIQQVIQAAGLGEVIRTWMGTEMNAPGFGGIPIFHAAQITNDRVATSGTGLGCLLGFVVGDDTEGMHLRYNSIAAVEGVNSMPGLQTTGQSQTAYGDIVPLPYTFYVVPPDKTDENLHPRATSFIEGVGARFGAALMVDGLKLT